MTKKSEDVVKLKPDKPLHERVVISYPAAGSSQPSSFRVGGMFTSPTRQVVAVTCGSHSAGSVNNTGNQWWASFSGVPSGTYTLQATGDSGETATQQITVG